MGQINLNDSLGGYTADDVLNGVIEGEIAPIHITRKNGVWELW